LVRRSLAELVSLPSLCTGALIVSGADIVHAVTYPAKDFRVHSNWSPRSSVPPSLPPRPTNNTVDSRSTSIFARALDPRPFLEQHGFRVPDNDLDSSAVSSREGSVQILESHPRTFSVPSIDLDTESEDDEVAVEDEEIEIASSVQNEDENTESAATAPEHGALGKDRGHQYIGAEGPEDSPAEAGVRGLNLKGPRLEDILSKPTALGTSQLNPIDLEGTSAPQYDTLDTESEDEGPEILPIPQPLSNVDEPTDWNEPKLAHQQYRMPTVDDDATDLEAEDLVTRIILDTQARNTKEKEPVRHESPEMPVDSVTGATDGFDSEDDDGFSNEDDFSDYFEHEKQAVKAQSSNTRSRVVSSSNPRTFSFHCAVTDPKAPRSQIPPRAAACYTRPPIQCFQPAVSISESIDVSQPDHDDLLPLSAIQRAPSPSDAALARKASDPKPTHDRTLKDYRRHAVVPEAQSFPPSERVYTPPFGMDFSRPFTYPGPDFQQQMRSRPYDQGPFTRRDDAAIPQQQPSLANDKLFTMGAEDDYKQFEPSSVWNDLHSCALKTDNFSSSCLEHRKENESQSSKINISSLVNTYYAEHPRPSKRKADDISSSNDSEESFFATAPTQPAASHPQSLTQPPPPSPYAALSEANDTHLPDAQARDTLPQAEVALLTQDTITEPVISSNTTTVTTKTVQTEGPARKKARTSTSTSGGIGKFVSGIAVGLVGAFAAFVATIPASVRDEALRELANGA